MISTVINPSGVARGKEFYRVDEYIYFVYFGAAVVQDAKIPGLCITKSEAEKKDQHGVGDDDVGKDHVSSDGVGDDGSLLQKPPPVRWESLLRSGSGARREESQLKFYPVLVDVRAAKIVDAGDPLPLHRHPGDYRPPKGITAVWPIRQDGSEGRWQLNQAAFRNLLANEHVKIGSIRQNPDKVTILYLPTGLRAKLASGELLVVGQDKYGGIELEFSDSDVISGRPKTQWATKAHSATDHGSSLLRRIIPGRKFPFPKSLYAIEDTLRFFVADKPDAVVLDFFAGSGTTAHAVMRLNKQDGGRRQSISVTNNEVGEREDKSFRKQGFRPGDLEWEQWGICDYITKPRVIAALTGETPNGDPIKGDYKFTDVFSMAEGFRENCEFFTLTYESPVPVSHNFAFARIAPLLWMRAGSEGRRIDALPHSGWGVADRYGLLTDLDQTVAFCKALERVAHVRVVFIVTNDDRRFQAVTRRIPDSVEPVRLYESYLSNFRFAAGD